MNWHDQGFGKNLTKKIDIQSKTPDSSTHGKTIEARTLAYVLPLKTTAQRDSISRPSTGLMIFNIDTGKTNIYNGHSWEEMIMSTTSSSSSSSSSTSSTSITLAP